MTSLPCALLLFALSLSGFPDELAEAPSAGPPPESARVEDISCQPQAEQVLGDSPRLNAYVERVA